MMTELRAVPWSLCETHGRVCAPASGVVAKEKVDGAEENLEHTCMDVPVVHHEMWKSENSSVL